VPYDQLYEMEQINPYFGEADVALVVGANDVTNPAAKNNKSSPLYGMPILEVERAKSIIVLSAASSRFRRCGQRSLFQSQMQMLLRRPPRKA